MKQLWVVLLLMLPVALATGNVNTSDTIMVMEGAKVLVHSSLTVHSEEGVGNLTLILTPDADDVRITIDEQKTDCLIQAEFARCGNLPKGSHNVSITYETSYPVAVSGDNTVFRYTDKLPYPSTQQQVTLQLPVGYIIPRERGKDESFYISPTPKEVYSDGEHIIIDWEQKGQELSISVVARRVVGPPLTWITISALAVAVAAGFSIWAVLRERRPRIQKQKKKQTVIPGLMESEQKVVDFIREKGEVWQKQIQLTTGFSKAKVSRVIRNLEARGVVTKTVYGNTNKIGLKS